MYNRSTLVCKRLSLIDVALRTAKPPRRALATAAVETTADLDISLTAPGLALPEQQIRSPVRGKQGGDLGTHLPKHVIPQNAYIPPYPYGERRLFKQANKGLYGQQTIQFGNNVSKKTETRTRRDWKPNVLSKALYSVALKKRIKLRMTSSVFKDIDREGGLDMYLLKGTERRIKDLGPMGWALRWTLMQKPSVIDRLRVEAAALGLDQTTIDERWPTLAMMKEQRVTPISQDDLDQHDFAETDEQQMWQPDDDDTTPLKSLTSRKPLAKHLQNEFRSIIVAANRYLAKDSVDSLEDGIKLAVLHASVRREAAIRQDAVYKNRLMKLFPDSELPNLKAKFNTQSESVARRAAYTAWKQDQIAAAGSPEAWRTQENPESAANHNAQIEAAGGIEAHHQAQKAKYKKEIETAEHASVADDLDDATREGYETAMMKAACVIEAFAAAEMKGQVSYAKMPAVIAAGKATFGRVRDSESSGSEAQSS